MTWRVAWIALVALTVVSAQEPRPKLALSLTKAVEIALAEDGNTKVQLAAEAERAASARKAQSFAALLPNVDASWGARSFTQDMRTFGLNLNVPIPGFTMPTFTGPVSVYDLRASATQTVFDFSSIRRWQSSGVLRKAAKLDSEDAKLQAASAAAKAYLNATRAETAVATAQANVEMAERLLKLSQSQKEAGTATGLDVVRAQVQVSSRKQKLIAAKESLETARLNLLRALNLNMDAEFELTDALKYQPAEIPEPAKAVEMAAASRPDLKAEALRERGAKLSYDAAKFQRLPSVGAFGDYGSIGTEPTSIRPTRTVGVTVKLPLFDGGRRDAQRAEAGATLRTEQIKARDMKQQAEMEVRNAVNALRSTDEQAQVAMESLALSEKELEQAERRYRSGVATSIEVTDAQTRLSEARENKDTAVYRARASAIDLAVALGDRNRIGR